MTRMPEAEIKQEADRVLNFLAAMPKYGNATVETPVLREIMLSTGGWMLACGDTYNIKTESLGGGVSRLTLERRIY